ncbi:hypothetical protein ABZ642_40455 [Streptomyces sp. NPDC007157]|uniref:hypothetical protein n=1 Tax=Streptomyces sp. NPDC007157 TaxID=3154681 RepID=UPI00340088C7
MPQRADTDLGDAGQVRPLPTGRDAIATRVKNHKGVISNRSAFMVVLVSQPIHLENEGATLAMHRTAEQYE